MYNRHLPVVRRPYLGAGFTLAGLGLSTSDLIAAADDLRQQTMLLGVSAAWRNIDMMAPPDFVIDTLTELKDNVVDPFARLKGTLMESVATFYKADEYASIGVQGISWWDAYLQPLLDLARIFQAAGLSVMPVPWTVDPAAAPINATFKGRIIKLLVEYEDAYREMAAVFDRTGWVQRKFINLGVWFDALGAAARVPDKIIKLADRASVLVSKASVTADDAKVAVQQATDALKRTQTTAENIDRLTKLANDLLKDQGESTAKRIKFVATGLLVLGVGVAGYFIIRRRRRLKAGAVIIPALG